MPRVNDTPDDNADEPTSASAASGEPAHPLERAHRFFLKAAPVIREVNETLERHGGLEQVRDKVVERAGEFVQRVDDVVSNATAIEGEVVERTPARDAAPSASDADARDADAASYSRARERTIPTSTPVQPKHGIGRWVALAIVVAAATFGALRLQRRLT